MSRGQVLYDSLKQQTHSQSQYGTNSGKTRGPAFNAPVTRTKSSGWSTQNKFNKPKERSCQESERLNPANKKGSHCWSASRCCPLIPTKNGISSHQAEIHGANTTTEWTSKAADGRIPEEQLLHIPKPNVSFPLHRSILILDVGQEARFSSRCLKPASFIPTGWSAGWRLKQIFEYLTLLKKIKKLF